MLTAGLPIDSSSLKLSLHIKPKRRPQGNKVVMKKINVSKLRNPSTAASLADLGNQLSELQLDENVEKDWERFWDYALFCA